MVTLPLLCLVTRKLRPRRSFSLLKIAKLAIMKGYNLVGVGQYHPLRSVLSLSPFYKLGNHGGGQGGNLPEATWLWISEPGGTIGEVGEAALGAAIIVVQAGRNKMNGI